VIPAPESAGGMPAGSLQARLFDNSKNNTAIDFAALQPIENLVSRFERLHFNSSTSRSKASRRRMIGVTSNRDRGH
jgi:hypothetical protein